MESGKIIPTCLHFLPEPVLLSIFFIEMAENTDNLPVVEREPVRGTRLPILTTNGAGPVLPGNGCLVNWIERTLLSVKEFQGKEYEKSYVPEKAQKLLKRWDANAAHYTAVEKRECF